jgi:hypothetical protein
MGIACVSDISPTRGCGCEFRLTQLSGVDGEDSGVAIFDVFVSYAHADRAHVLASRDALDSGYGWTTGITTCDHRPDGRLSSPADENVRAR